MNTLEVTVAAHTTDITDLVESDVSIEQRLLNLEQTVNGTSFIIARICAYVVYAKVMFSGLMSSVCLQREGVPSPSSPSDPLLSGQLAFDLF